MKTLYPSKAARLALLACVLTGAALSAGAQSFLNAFSSAGDISGWRFDFGAGGSTVSWNSTENFGGGPTGALQLDMTLNLNSAAFTYDRYGSPADLTGYTISFDLKVDPISATDFWGNNGYMDFAIRNTGGYNWVGQPSLSGNVNDANGWVHYSAPASGGDQTRAFTIQLYGGPSQNIVGPVRLYLDNIQVQPVPEPGTFALAGLGLAALLVLRRRR